MSGFRERLAVSEASQGGGIGRGWWLEVGRARVGAILGDRWARVSSVLLPAKQAKVVGCVKVGG